jgi:hypothetical protein
MMEVFGMPMVNRFAGSEDGRHRDYILRVLI